MEIEQTSPGAVHVAMDEPRVSDTRGEDGFAPPGISSSLAGPLSGLLVLAGAGMQGIANGTMDAFCFGFLLFVAGYALVKTVFLRGRAEQRAFLLTFGVCIFAGGAVQWYSLAVFGAPQSFVDAIGFLQAVFDSPPYYTWDEIKTLWIDGREVSRGAPLAVYIWQGVYHLRRQLGFDFGPYVGVMFNALVMGFTASVTVATARELFGDDRWRLRRVGTLFAFCGLFILFGAILLRDCFTTFFNALVILGIVRWLCKPNLRNLLFAAMLTGIAVGAMAYLRFESIVLFGLFWLLGVLSWLSEERLNTTRFFAIGVGLIVFLFASSYLIEYLDTSLQFRSEKTGAYIDILRVSSSQKSLAMRLIVHQPLPIRAVLGVFYLMLFPIPLWAYFFAGAGEYLLIKGYNGFYQLFVMPLVLAGILNVLERFFREGRRLTPLHFLVIYVLLNTVGVAVTSLEQRHLAQFLPAMIILAVVPDTRERKTRRKVHSIALIWGFGVILVHLGWMTMAR